MTNERYKDRERLRQERIAAAKAAARRRGIETAAKYSLGFVGVVVGVALLILCAAFIVQFAWNAGVVALIVACGGHAAKISLSTAFAVFVAIAILNPTGRGVNYKRSSE